MGDGAARVEADFDRMRALVTEAPLGEDWEAAADPKGEIVASRDVAAEQEDASSATATPEDADQPPQDTEAWSHEEAMSAEGDSGRALGRRIVGPGPASERRRLTLGPHAGSPILVKAGRERLARGLANGLGGSHTGATSIASPAAARTLVVALLAICSGVAYAGLRTDERQVAPPISPAEGGAKGSAPVGAGPGATARAAGSIFLPPTATTGDAGGSARSGEPEFPLGRLLAAARRTAAPRSPS